jgi:hypothetical protein
MKTKTTKTPPRRKKSPVVVEMVELVTSPSNFHRLALCPGSGRLELKFPSTSSPAADRGTRLHEELGKMVAGQIPTNVTKAEEEMLSTAVDLLEVETVEIDPTSMEIEKKFDLHFLGLTAERGGTADYVYVNEKTGDALIADFKTGRGPWPRPSESWQLRIYAIALLETTPLTRVKLCYIAPERQDGRPVAESEWVTVDQIIMWGGEAKARIANAKAPDAPLIPSEEGCKYCRAKGSCPAILEKIAPLNLPTSKPPMELGKMTTSEWLRKATPEMRRELWDSIKLAEDYLTELRSTCLAEAITGQDFEGLVAKPSRIDKVWQDPFVAESHLVKALGEEAFKKSLISPAAAKKLGFDRPELVVDSPAAVTLKAVRS